MDESTTASQIPQEQHIYSEDVIKAAETIKSRMEKDARGEMEWLTLEESLSNLRECDSCAKH
jgi:hypothetical protein